MLVMASQKYNCSEEMLTIVSMLSAPPVFARPRGRVNEADRMHSAFVHPDGDHLTLINVYKAYIESKLNCFKPNTL
jgi:HrpA-like RNA helicase